MIINFWNCNNPLSQFWNLYKTRPFDVNEGGMKTAKSFYLWLILNTIQPENIIESGVWRGCSTWLIEKTVPNANLWCFDPNVNNTSFYWYRSNKATYVSTDILQYEFEDINLEKTLIIYDDHQDILPRLELCSTLNVRYILIDDDYFDPNDHVSLWCLQHLTKDRNIQERFSQLKFRCQYRFPKINSIFKSEKIPELHNNIMTEGWEDTLLFLENWYRAQ
jgi:hypothetical protein